MRHVFNGGQGTNTLDDSAAPDAVDVAVKEEGIKGIASGATQGGLGSDTLSRIQNVIGSSFADSLRSACYPECIAGHGGDGLIDGGPGDDVIRVDNPNVGENSDGLIKGGPGDDVIRLVNNNSGKLYPSFVLRGGPGDDALEVENHNSSRSNKTYPKVVGGTGDDVLVGSSQEETLNGGPGADICKGGGGKDSYIGCE